MSPGAIGEQSLTADDWDAVADGLRGIRSLASSVACGRGQPSNQVPHSRHVTPIAEGVDQGAADDDAVDDAAELTNVGGPRDAEACRDRDRAPGTDVTQEGTDPRGQGRLAPVTPTKETA